MRSVFVWLGAARAADVEKYLGRTYPLRPGPPWVFEIGGDPALTIYFNDDPNVDAELGRLGHEPGLTVVADVSGRHAADDEVRGFVCGLLDHFGGDAHDEYGDHHWTSEDIRCGRQPQGHPFFDCRRWEEQFRRADR